MNRMIAIAIAAAAVLGGVYFWPASPSLDLPGLGVAQAQSTDAGQSAEIDKSLVKDMTLGDENAPLKVIEYASFTCPHCKHFHDNSFKQFKTNYIDTGKVHFTYREVYFDPYGLWAGLVARCGDGTKYFGISDMIYDQQATWTKADSAKGIADNLAKIGKTAGLTEAELDACLQNEPKAKAMVAVYQENAERDGIKSTPSFMIDGELAKGAMEYDEFSALLDEKLSAK